MVRVAVAPRLAGLGREIAEMAAEPVVEAEPG